MARTLLQELLRRIIITKADQGSGERWGSDEEFWGAVHPVHPAQEQSWWLGGEATARAFYYPLDSCTFSSPVNLPCHH